MEFILQNTDIFDEAIDEKFNNVIIANKDKLITGNIYKLIVSFHVNLLEDIRFEEFNIPPDPCIANLCKTNKIIKKDKSDVMSYQLNRMKHVLNKNGIIVYLSEIKGDIIESEDIIKIEIFDDNSEPNCTVKGKKNKRMHIINIVPNEPKTRETITKLASKAISKIFNDLMDALRDNKLMSELLEIKETDDREILFQAFDEQYGDLWLCSKERKTELLKRLRERGLFVLNKLP